jgi:transcriptional regulator with XRE-family HTH domain
MSTVVDRSSYDELSASREGRRLLEQETLVLAATELICELLEKKRLSRAELAKRIGKSKAFVSQILSGRRNMTLRTLAEVAWALDARIEMHPARKASQDEEMAEAQFEMLPHWPQSWPLLSTELRRSVPGIPVTRRAVVQFRMPEVA